eukprot:1161364-Pelagomonas_calceolata.AAC.11
MITYLSLQSSRLHFCPIAASSSGVFTTPFLQLTHARTHEQEQQQNKFFRFLLPKCMGAF